MSRTIALAFVAASFLFVGGMASVGWAGEAPKSQLQQTPIGVQPLPSPCPPGWHKKAGGNPLACVPNKPAPIVCPQGQEYYDTGCEVGCRYVPR